MSDFAGSSTPPGGGTAATGASGGGGGGVGRFSISKSSSKGDRKLLIEHDDGVEAGSASSYGSVPEAPMALRGLAGDDRPGRHPGEERGLI